MVSGVHQLMLSPWVEDKEGGASPSEVLPHPLCTPPAQHLAHWIAMTLSAEELSQSKGNYGGDNLMQPGVLAWLLDWERTLPVLGQLVKFKCGLYPL